MKPHASLALATLLAFGSLGCGGSPSRCVPGASAACTCPSSASGAQVCSTDGTFAPCLCEAPATATSGGSTEDERGAETEITTGTSAGCVPDPIADAARRANATMPTPIDTAWVILEDLELIDDHRSGVELCVTFAEWGGSEGVTYWCYGPMPGHGCVQFLGEVEDARGDRDVPSL